MPKLTTSDITQEVDLRSDDTDFEPMTVSQLFEDSLTRFGDKKALHVKKNDAWTAITFNEYYAKCVQFAKSVLAIGLNRFQGVCMIGSNAPEYLITNFGTIFAGAVSAGIYATNSPAACEYIIEHSDAGIVVCDGVAQLKKIISIHHNLPKLKAIVVYNEPVPEDIECNVPIYAFDDFLKLGEKVEDEVIQARMKEQKPGECCTLIYTSGTTGNPKGVMISHDACTWQVRTFVAKIEKHLDNGMKIDNSWRSISYLPLSHIAAQLLDLYVPVQTGERVYFAQKDALQGSLQQTILDVRPTWIIAVPRTWEKLTEKVRQLFKDATGTQAALLPWAQNIGIEKCRRMQYGNEGSEPWGTALANALVLNEYKKAIGLDEALLCVSSAAPMSKELGDVFSSIGIPVYDIYGSSEASGAQTLCMPGSWKVGTVGTTMEGSLIKTDPHTNELCIYGRNVMMGYLKSEEQTKQAIDEDGYFHTGDCAHIDQDGFVQITGRLKEIIITAGGENIPPLLIEAALKEAMPLVSNVMLVGDRRRFLSTLITFPVKMDPNTKQPTTELDDRVLHILQEIGSSATTVQEAKECPKVKQYLEEGIAAANAKAISHAQTVRKYLILDSDFSPAGGELTPTLKLRRQSVSDKYASLIDEIYA